MCHCMCQRVCSREAHRGKKGLDLNLVVTKKKKKKKTHSTMVTSREARALGHSRHW